jgi:hypothetical protein
MDICPSVAILPGQNSTYPVSEKLEPPLCCCREAILEIKGCERHAASRPRARSAPGYQKVGRTAGRLHSPSWSASLRVAPRRCAGRSPSGGRADSDRRTYPRSPAPAELPLAARARSAALKPLPVRCAHREHRRASAAHAGSAVTLIKHLFPSMLGFRTP